MTTKEMAKQVIDYIEKNARNGKTKTRGQG